MFAFDSDHFWGSILTYPEVSIFFESGFVTVIIKTNKNRKVGPNS